MSYQTKKEAMGYIIKAMMICDCGIRTIAKGMKVADELIEGDKMTNADTSYVLRMICDRLDLSDDARSKLLETLSWEGFDYTTTDEAGELYDRYYTFLVETRLKRHAEKPEYDDEK